MPRYSSKLMEHFEAPRNLGPLEQPDAVGFAGRPGAGPHLILYLRVDGDRVLEAHFQTHGCGVSIACGSVLTEMLVGLTLTRCMGLVPGDVIEALDGVPAHKLHCPDLAIRALRDALAKIGHERQ